MLGFWNHIFYFKNYFIIAIFGIHKKKKKQLSQATWPCSTTAVLADFIVKCGSTLQFYNARKCVYFDGSLTFWKCFNCAVLIQCISMLLPSMFIRIYIYKLFVLMCVLWNEYSFVWCCHECLEFCHNKLIGVHIFRHYIPQWSTVVGKWSKLCTYQTAELLTKWTGNEIFLKN